MHIAPYYDSRLIGLEARYIHLHFFIRNLSFSLTLEPNFCFDYKQLMRRLSPTRCSIKRGRFKIAPIGSVLMKRMTWGLSNSFILLTSILLCRHGHFYTDLSTLPQS